MPNYSCQIGYQHKKQSLSPLPHFQHISLKLKDILESKKKKKKKDNLDRDVNLFCYFLTSPWKKETP